MDDTDLFAQTLVPALLKVPLEAREGETDQQDLLDFTEESRNLLRGWDHTTPASDSDASAAAAYYNAVWRNLCELLFDDELPPDMKSDGGDRFFCGGGSFGALSTPPLARISSSASGR